MLIQGSTQVSGKFSSDLNICSLFPWWILHPEYLYVVFFSGELIGIDYLFNQTGKSLEEVGAERDEGEDNVAEEEKEPDTFDEGFDEEEEFEYLTMSVVDSFLPTQQCRLSSKSSCKF